MAEPTTTDLALGGPVGTLRAAITSILNSGDQSLTFGRGVIDAELGFILRDIDESLSDAQKRKRQVETRPAVAKDSLIADVEGLHEKLEESLEFILPQSFPLPDLLEKLAELLLHPAEVPGEPCLAPAPLLRDLLDVALGQLKGGLGAIVTKVGQTVWDFILPAGVEGEGLTQFIESILADPITAALNFILGRRDQIDCVVTGGLGVGEGVIETLIRRLRGALTEALA